MLKEKFFKDFEKITKQVDGIIASDVKHDSFDCYICKKNIILHGYPHGTYDYYSVLQHCTAHNPPGRTITFDGFHSPELRFCDDCSRKVCKMIENMRILHQD